MGKRISNSKESESKKSRHSEEDSTNNAAAETTTAPAVRAPPPASISVHPESALTENRLVPIKTFAQLGEHLPKWLVNGLCADFTTPTPVQQYSWGAVLENCDVISIARTGSGKTLAFGLPALSFCLQVRKIRPNKPRVLVLAPTRELAMQTARVVEVAKNAAPTKEEKSKLNIACVYGGVEKRPQREALKTSLFVVATPGRLLDFIEEGAVDLGCVNMFILDEADRMLDMGFEKEVKRIAGLIKDGKRDEAVQTLMFSATWPNAIRKLASEYLRSDDRLIRISVGNGFTAATPADGEGQEGGEHGHHHHHNHHGHDHDGPMATTSVKQHVMVVEHRDKDQHLEKILSTHHQGKEARTIVFCLYKKEAARVEALLNRKGWNCVALHGDLTQAARTQAFDNFRQGRVNLLVATDVAARGVDLPNVEHVVNYTFPLTIEDYVHRIGRTGRGDKTGQSHTFFTRDDKAHAGSLVNVMKAANQEVPECMYQFSLITKKKVDPNYGAFGPRADLVGKTGTKITFGDDDDE